MFIGVTRSGFEIGICAGLDQMPCALDAAFARRVEQRREPTLVHVLGPRFLDDLALPLADDAARIEVGAARREQLDHLGLALRGSPHQCRLPAPVLCRVDVGARVEQELGSVDVARPGHGHERRLALVVLGIRIGACV